MFWDEKPTKPLPHNILLVCSSDMCQKLPAMITSFNNTSKNQMIESSNLNWQEFIQDVDIDILRRSSHILAPHFNQVIQEFYNHISTHKELMDVLKTRNILPAELHQTFLKYLETLFSGTYDAAYIDSRKKIGETHYRISLPLSWYQHTQEILKWILIRNFDKTLHFEELKRINYHVTLDQFQSALAKVMTFDLLTITDSYVKQYTSELQNAKQEAENASKAKNMILAAVSHDLRSPLFALTAFSDLLLEDKNLNLESQNYAKAIHRNSNVLLQLVNNLLELIKSEYDKDGVKVEAIDLHSLLNELVQDTKALVKDKPIEVEKMDESLGEFANIQSNKQYLHRILQNLLGNSAKFTKSGKIQIECYFNLRQHQYHFLVRDTGRGIQSSDHAAIFKEFFQIRKKDDPPGTGLGLSLSKNLAQRLGGDLCLKDSLPGKGSCFELILPVH